MRNVILNLTKEERQALAVMASQYMENLLLPLKGNSFMVEQEIAGEKVRMVGAKLRLDYHGNTHNQLNAHYGRDMRLSESLLTTLLRLATYDVESKKSSDKITHESHGLMHINHSSGTFQLFDSPVIEHAAVSISLKQAGFHKSDIIDRDDELASMTDGMIYSEFKLSSEQYVRMIRMDSAEVPCTISHHMGQMNDAPPVGMKEQQKIKERMKEYLSVMFQPLQEQADVVKAMVENKSLTTKKAISDLRHEMEVLKSIYESLIDGLGERKLDAAQDVVHQFAKEMELQINREVLRLPEHKRDMLPIFKLALK